MILVSEAPVREWDQYDDEQYYESNIVEQGEDRPKESTENTIHRTRHLLLDSKKYSQNK